MVGTLEESTTVRLDADGVEISRLEVRQLESHLDWSIVVLLGQSYSASWTVAGGVSILIVTRMFPPIIKEKGYSINLRLLGKLLGNVKLCLLSRGVNVCDSLFNVH